MSHRRRLLREEWESIRERNTDAEERRAELAEMADGDVPPCKAVGCDEPAVSEVGWCEEHDDCQGGEP